MNVENINAIAAGVVLVINAIGVVVIAVMSRKLNSIHTAVNSRMDTAVAEIKALKREILKKNPQVDVE